MPDLLYDVLGVLDAQGVRHCLLRDGDEMDRCAGGGEIDLLVDEADLGRLATTLGRFGFLRLRDWGHQPHHFFVAYLETLDVWLTLDVVTRIAYGRPTRALATNLSENCLAHRQRRGPVCLPSPEDELVTLLLHCVLDKARFADARRQRLRALRRRIVRETYLSDLLDRYWLPGTSWAAINAMLDAEAWDALLAEGRAVSRRLAARNRLATLGRPVRDRVLRKVCRCVSALRPRVPMVAVLAPDGAGKSATIAAIEKSFYFRASTIYMGLYSQAKNAGRSKRRVPGMGFLGHLLGQWTRYLVARWHQGCGRLVLFDRYPYDSLLPQATSPGLLRRWRRLLLGHACPTPGLVVVLDAPGEVLFARKGEHSPDVLERQRQGYLALQARLPHAVVIDATNDLHSVCRQVTAAIWRRCAERLDPPHP